jgi:hypothetical protein
VMSLIRLYFDCIINDGKIIIIPPWKENQHLVLISIIITLKEAS